MSSQLSTISDVPMDYADSRQIRNEFLPNLKNTPPTLTLSIGDQTPAQYEVLLTPKDCIMPAVSFVDVSI